MWGRDLQCVAVEVLSEVPGLLLLPMQKRCAVPLLPSVVFLLMFTQKTEGTAGGRRNDGRRVQNTLEYQMRERDWEWSGNQGSLEVADQSQKKLGD